MTGGIFEIRKSKHIAVRDPAQGHLANIPSSRDSKLGGVTIGRTVARASRPDLGEAAPAREAPQTPAVAGRVGGLGFPGPGPGRRLRWPLAESISSWRCTFPPAPGDSEPNGFPRAHPDCPAGLFLFLNAMSLATRRGHPPHPRCARDDPSSMSLTEVFRFGRGLRAPVGASTSGAFGRASRGPFPLAGDV